MNREGLVGDGMLGDHLRHNDNEVIEFSVLREVRREVSRTGTLKFWRADFSLLRNLVD